MERQVYLKIIEKYQIDGLKGVCVFPKVVVISAKTINDAMQRVYEQFDVACVLKASYSRTDLK